MDAAGEELADRIRAIVAPASGIEERRMFGTRAFLLDGRILAGARPGGVLLIKVAAEDEAVLLLREGAARAVMGPRTMSARWIDVAPSAIADDDGLLFWIDAARAGAD